MDDYDDFNTSGYEDYDVGAGILANAGALRSLAKSPAKALSPAAVALSRRLSSPAMRQAIQQRPVSAAVREQIQAASQSVARATGVSEARAREIVGEELAALFEAGLINNSQMVPWPGMPSRRGPRDESMWPLGLGLATFSSTSVGTQFLTVSPQRPFRGERLVLEVRRYGVAATVDPPTVLIDEFRVGDIPQRLGGGSLPASVFQPDAQGVRLSLDATVPGVLIEVGIRLDQNTLAPGDGIVVSGAIIGRSVDGWRG